MMKDPLFRGLFARVCWMGWLFAGVSAQCFSGFNEGG